MLSLLFLVISVQTFVIFILFLNLMENAKYKIPSFVYEQGAHEKSL